MQHYTFYLYLKTALHVSGGSSTHHQERIQLCLQHLVLVTPLLLPVSMVAGSSNGVQGEEIYWSKLGLGFHKVCTPYSMWQHLCHQLSDGGVRVSIE